MKLSDNIRNFRTFRNIKQQELADALGKSKSVISNWERGENSPDVETIERMCRIFHVTPNELLGWEENKEYIAFVKRQEEYKSLIQDLHKAKKEIEQQIRDLEVRKIKDNDPPIV